MTDTPLPAAGGSYIREPDGSLRPADLAAPTAEPRPRRTKTADKEEG